MGLSLGLGLSLVSGYGGAFSPLSLSPAAFWLPQPPFIFEEEDGTGAVAPAGAVGYDADQSGGSRHIIQANAASRPAYNTAGGRHWLTLDGGDVLLATFSEIPQPFYICAACSVTGAGGGAEILGSSDLTPIFAYAADDTVHIYNGGSEVHDPTVIGFGVDFVVTAVCNGASSGIAIDGAAFTTGDAGAGTLTTFGVGHVGGTGGRAMTFYGGVILPYAPSSEQDALVRAYFAGLQGRTL